jgi:hypothetical protein
LAAVMLTAVLDVELEDKVVLLADGV